MGNRIGARIQIGFTLVEMLISLAIFSSVLSLVIMGLHQGQLQWMHSSRQLDEANFMLKRQTWLRQMFAQANAAFFRIDYGAEAPFFVGTKENVSFLSNAPVISGPGTYATVKLFVRKQDNGLEALIFSQRAYSDPYLNASSDTDEGHALILLHDIQKFSLSYFLSPRMEATPMELKYNSFKPRPEGYWFDEYDANLEQSLPQYIVLRFSQNHQQFVWYFELPTTSEALIQESQIVVQ